MGFNMFNFLIGNFRLYAILAVIMAALGTFWYVSGLRADLAESEANNKILKEALDTQQKAIDQLARDSKKIKESNDRLTATVRSQNKDLEDLRKRLKAKNLGGTAATNPVEAEKQVNQISKNMERCLELASGAPLTEGEKNAKSINEINSECPTLANPNYRSTSN